MDYGCPWLPHFKQAGHGNEEAGYACWNDLGSVVRVVWLLGATSGGVGVNHQCGNKGSTSGCPVLGGDLHITSGHYIYIVTTMAMVASHVRNCAP